MVNSSMEELFNSIENSSLYKRYMKMSEILNRDSSIKEQLDEIKILEQEATYLESIGDDKYKEIDEEIKRRAELLNSNHIYQEYLDSMNEFNDEISMSSKMIEKYVEEKV